MKKDGDSVTNKYLVHQARQFHTTARENLGSPFAAVANLAIAVEYLIELEENRCDG
jgi:hypothetical protein